MAPETTISCKVSSLDAFDGKALCKDQKFNSRLLSGNKDPPQGPPIASGHWSMMHSFHSWVSRKCCKKNGGNLLKPTAFPNKETSLLFELSSLNLWNPRICMLDTKASPRFKIKSCSSRWKPPDRMRLWQRSTRHPHTGKLYVPLEEQFIETPSSINLRFLSQKRLWIKCDSTNDLITMPSCWGSPERSSPMFSAILPMHWNILIVSGAWDAHEIKFTPEFISIYMNSFFEQIGGFIPNAQ